MENNYGITPEIDIWTVDFSYFSHVKRNTETFVAKFLSISPDIPLSSHKQQIRVCQNFKINLTAKIDMQIQPQQKENPHNTYNPS